MNELFNLDNKFFTTVSKIVDCFGLSIMWFICCIPIFTIGIATTSLYYAVNKNIRCGRSYMWREYWYAFRTNFKQSTIVWLILMVVYSVIGADWYIMYELHKAGDKISGIYYIFIIFFVIAILMTIYIFPYIARFSDGIKRIFINAFLIAFGNIWYTVLLALLLAVTCFCLYAFPPAIIIIPSVYMLLKSMIMEKVFKKYMSPEEIAAEIIEE